MKKIIMFLFFIVLNRAYGMEEAMLKALVTDMCLIPIPEEFAQSFDKSRQVEPEICKKLIETPTIIPNNNTADRVPLFRGKVSVTEKCSQLKNIPGWQKKHGGCSISSSSSGFSVHMWTKIESPYKIINHQKINKFVIIDSNHEIWPLLVENKNINVFIDDQRNFYLEYIKQYPNLLTRIRGIEIIKNYILPTNETSA